MADIRLYIDGAELQGVLDGPTGFIARHMLRRADIVRRAAIRDCPKRGAKGTHHLSQTIVTRYFEDEGRFSVSVVALAPYAAAVHNGAQPHDIPNAFGRGPTFGIGGQFAGKFHPGIIPEHAQPFLSKNAYLFGGSSLAKA